MENPPGEGAPETSPEQPAGTAEEFFHQAEAARKSQVWEEAIRLYRRALQKAPDHMDSLQGLALSFEAKGREPGYESYLQAAMGEYRKMIALDPACLKAHDALLAAAVKQDLLGDLLEEYKARIAKGGAVDVFQGTLRKIQALLLLRARPAQNEILPPPPLVSFIFGLVAPCVGAVALLVSFIVRLKSASPQAPMISYALVKLAMSAFFSFIGYRTFLIWRASR